VTHNPPVIDGLTFIPTSFMLPVEAHVSNNTIGSSSEENKNNIVAHHPLTMMLTTTDSIDIENDSHNMSNNEKSKLNLDFLQTCKI